MADSPPPEELIQELQNRSVVGTPILDSLQNSEVMLNRNISDRMLKRIRFRIKQRRTPEGFAARASNIVSGPISQTVDDELKFIVEQNVESYLERRLQE